jgi:ATP-dependent 26S proteasome regulatory subunit
MIGGLDEVKEALRQCITYPLKYPRLYKDGIAAEAVKGVLLFGPPGTGKTMLAKAVATEGGATFLSIDASTIENKWLGESEKNAKVCRVYYVLYALLLSAVLLLDASLTPPLTLTPTPTPRPCLPLPAASRPASST